MSEPIGVFFAAGDVWSMHDPGVPVIVFQDAEGTRCVFYREKITLEFKEDT